jgi:hypothetical protein
MNAALLEYPYLRRSVSCDKKRSGFLVRWVNMKCSASAIGQYKLLRRRSTSGFAWCYGSSSAFPPPGVDDDDAVSSSESAT